MHAAAGNVEVNGVCTRIAIGIVNCLSQRPQKPLSFVLVTVNVAAGATTANRNTVPIKSQQQVEIFSHVLHLRILHLNMSGRIHRQSLLR